MLSSQNVTLLTMDLSKIIVQYLQQRNWRMLDILSPTLTIVVELIKMKQ